MNRVRGSLPGGSMLDLQMDGVPRVGELVSLLNVGTFTVIAVTWLRDADAPHNGPLYPFLNLKAHE